MSTPGACPRCQTPLPFSSGGGVIVCPACGSKVPDTPPGAETHATPISPVAATHYPDTVTALDPHLISTASVELDGDFALTGVATIPRLANYTDLSFIGSGGMGVVYRAQQRKTERAVALKFLHAGGVIDPALRARFDGEARALARVDHPHIVRIFEVGEDDERRPYFSMEYVPGGTLGRRLRSGPLPHRDAARIIAGVAAAVHAAHQARVLHRDIKPGNILLAPDGTPKITDFGLAKIGDKNDRLTSSGAVMGTPSYMAPEQAAGHRIGFDPRIDVYGLGATLYEMLCGQVPYKGSSNAATLRLVEKAQLTPPSMRKPGLPEELEAICVHCLEKDPNDRYQSAQELANDLNAWLAGEETKVRPLTRWGRTKRWVRRHKVAVALVALLPFVALGVAAADPENRINWQLRAGRPVTLIGEQGGPSWHEWKLGPVELTRSADEDGTCGFQTHHHSVLVLARDPRSDTYSVSVELKHLSKGGDNAQVGLFVGLYDTPAQPNLALSRYIGVGYSEFWSQAELNDPDRFKPSHGLDMADMVIARDGEIAHADGFDYGVVRFTPVNSQVINHPWRKIRLDVSPAGVNVFWEPAPGATVPSHQILADEIASRVAGQHKIWTRFYPNFSMPERPWTPRGALGVFATNSAVAVRNYKLQPSGVAP